MSYTLLWVTLLTAGINWLAVGMKWQKIEYAAKPATLIVLLGWLWQISGFEGPTLWFGLGLLCSLAGDIFLMLPQKKFVQGVVSFGFAQILYIIGLNPTFPPINLGTLILLVLIFITIHQVSGVLVDRIASSGLREKSKLVVAYICVLSGMLLSALITLVRPDSDWLNLHALMVSAGALLFVYSDVLIAWNRYVTPVSKRDLKVIIPYQLGQIGLVVGAALHFMS
jgi:uncharacterized membrane protein YhhN